MPTNNNHGLGKIKSDTETSLQLKQLNKMACSFKDCMI